MDRFDVVLWDVDGTLLDFLAAEKAVIQSLFQEFGLGRCTDGMLARYSEINREYWRKLERGEMSKQQILVKRFEDFFREEGLDVSLGEAFNAAYQVRLGDTIVFCDDSKALVESLRGKVRQYVVSNGTVTAQTKKLRRSGFDQLMDGVFLSEELGYEKPAIEFFDHVFRVIQAPDKDRVLIVGDSLTSDMEGGFRAGIKTCWYNPEGLPCAAPEKIDYEIQNLQEIKKIL